MLIFSSVFMFLDSTQVVVHDSQHKKIIIMTIFYSGSWCSPWVFPQFKTSCFIFCVFKIPQSLAPPNSSCQYAMTNKLAFSPVIPFMFVYKCYPDGTFLFTKYYSHYMITERHTGGFSVLVTMSVYVRHVMLQTFLDCSTYIL